MADFFSYNDDMGQLNPEPSYDYTLFPQEEEEPQNFDHEVYSTTHSIPFSQEKDQTPQPLPSMDQYESEEVIDEGAVVESSSPYVCQTPVHQPVKIKPKKVFENNVAPLSTQSDPLPLGQKKSKRGRPPGVKNRFTRDANGMKIPIIRDENGDILGKPPKTPKPLRQVNPLKAVNSKKGKLMQTRDVTTFETQTPPAPIENLPEEPIKVQPVILTKVVAEKEKIVLPPTLTLVPSSLPVVVPNIVPIPPFLCDFSTKIRAGSVETVINEDLINPSATYHDMYMFECQDNVLWNVCYDRCKNKVFVQINHNTRRPVAMFFDVADYERNGQIWKYSIDPIKGIKQRKVSLKELSSTSLWKNEIINVPSEDTHPLSKKLGYSVFSGIPRFELAKSGQKISFQGGENKGVAFYLNSSRLSHNLLCQISTSDTGSFKLTIKEILKADGLIKESFSLVLPMKIEDLHQSHFIGKEDSSVKHHLYSQNLI